MPVFSTKPLLAHGGISGAYASGEWSITDTTIDVARTGIGVENATGDWVINNLTITHMRRWGVRGEDNSGNWSIRNITLVQGDAGIAAPRASGDWSIQESNISHIKSGLTFPWAKTGIYIPDSDGEWTIHTTSFTNVEGAGINATNTSPKINATQNWWGASDGPSGNFNGSGVGVVGNITVKPYYKDANLTSLSGNSTSCVNGVVTGSDNMISLTEIQQAINWWAEGKEVPDTGGETISLTKIQSLINAWAEGPKVSCS